VRLPTADKDSRPDGQSRRLADAIYRIAVDEGRYAVSKSRRATTHPDRLAGDTSGHIDHRSQQRRWSVSSHERRTCGSHGHGRWTVASDRRSNWSSHGHGSRTGSPENHDGNKCYRDCNSRHRPRASSVSASERRVRGVACRQLRRSGGRWFDVGQTLIPPRDCRALARRSLLLRCERGPAESRLAKGSHG
jgi:hypothetical protein